jgi:hypothetical protein
VKKAGLIGTGLIAAKAAGAKNLGGFSIWRVLGVSALKAKISRGIGIPLTPGGRRRKVGAFIFRLFGF